MVLLSRASRCFWWVSSVLGCSTRVWIADELGGASDEAATQGGSGAGERASTSGGATGGSGATAGPSDGVPATGSCSFGADQTCNDDPRVSSLWGRCLKDATCECHEGFVANPVTGKCALTSSVTCYSPHQNLEHTGDSGALGCECDPASDADLCRTTLDGGNVALTCTDGRWQVLAEARCASDACRITRSVDLSRERTLGMRVAHFGQSFVLTGYDSVQGNWAAYVTASWQGETGAQRFDMAGSWLLGAATIDRGLLAPELIVLGRRKEEPSRFRSTAWQQGSSVPVEEHVLFESDSGALSSRFDVRSSLDGRRVLFAEGHLAPGLRLTSMALDAGGVPEGEGTVRQIDLPGLDLDFGCLQRTASGGVSYLTQDELGDVAWSFSGPMGGSSGSGDVAIPDLRQLPSGPCPLLATDATSHPHLAYLASDGKIQIAFMRGPGGGAPVLYRSISSTSQRALDGFGVIDSDYVFVRRQSNRLFVERFDAPGAELSDPVELPDSVTSSAEVIDVVGNALYLTYLTEKARVIAEVTCP